MPWRRGNGEILGLLLCVLPGGLLAQGYTVAFSSFAPADTDIFVADGAGAKARAVLEHPALDYNASLTADGNVIFTSERHGSADIYRARVDGSELVRLVDDPAFDDQGVLSPDGRSLAFVSSRAGQADVWVLDLEAHTTRNLTDAPSGEFRPSWSSDGRWIAFTSDRDTPRRSCVGQSEVGPGPFITPQYTAVFVVGTDGSGLRRVSNVTEVAGSPVWSADGAKLTFHTAAPEQVCNGGLMFATGTSQIAQVDLESGARTTLTAGEGLKLFPRPVGSTGIAYVTGGGVQLPDRVLAGAFGRPVWSNDGRTMVFYRERAKRGDPGFVAVAHASRDPKFALLALTGPASFSPDGSRFVFGSTDFSRGSAGTGVLVVANADGTGARAAFAAAATDNLTSPAWSPRGDTIVFGLGGFFRRSDTDTARLMSVRPDGTDLKPLTDGKTNDGMASWSPDGAHVVFRTASGPARGLHILNLASGERRTLDTGSDRDTFPFWSPRGDWITFTSQRDGDYEIYRIRPDGTGLERLTRFAGNDAHASISPDGEWIAFATSQQGFKDEALGLVVGARPPPFQSYGEIAVMRIDGSDARLLTDNSTEEGVPVWVPR